MREFYCNERDADGYDTGNRIEYIKSFRQTAAQKILSELRISSGEKEKMTKTKTIDPQGYETGMKCEQMFADLTQCGQMDDESALNPQGIWWASEYYRIVHKTEEPCYDADFILRKTNEDDPIKLDVKGQKYRSKPDYPYDGRPPADRLVWVPMYNVEFQLSGFYNTDYYVFMFAHENNNAGYIAGIVDVDEFIEKADTYPAMRIGDMNLPKSKAMKLEDLVYLDRTEELGIKYNFGFENVSDDECFYIVNKGIDCTISCSEILPNGDENLCYKDVPFKTRVEKNFPCSSYTKKHLAQLDLNKKGYFIDNENLGKYICNFAEYKDNKKYTLHVPRENVHYKIGS